MTCNPLEAEISKQADDSNTRCTSLHTHTPSVSLFPASCSHSPTPGHAVETWGWNPRCWQRWPITFCPDQTLRVSPSKNQEPACELATVMNHQSSSCVELIVNNYTVTLTIKQVDFSKRGRRKRTQLFFKINFWKTRKWQVETIWVGVYPVGWQIFPPNPIAFINNVLNIK